MKNQKVSSIMILIGNQLKRNPIKIFVAKSTKRKVIKSAKIALKEMSSNYILVLLHILIFNKKHVRSI